MRQPTLISVIICAHNSRPDYLGRVLEALRVQSMDDDGWEILLVDSASTPPLAKRVDLSWHARARHVREDEAGLTRARLRGIAESVGDLVIFVDDDNVLDPEFLATSAQIYQEKPHIGAWSGQCLAEFDSRPPEWTRRYWGNLVIRELDRDRWSNLPLNAETMPCGAGLCVRRNVAATYARLHESGARQFLLDRVGTSLLSGGDNDLAACACEVGLGVGVFAALRLKHLIPANRLREDYLLRLTEGISFSTTILQWYWQAYHEMPTYGLKTRIADMLRVLLLKPRERRFFRATRRGQQRAREYLARRSPTVNAAQPQRRSVMAESVAP
jgi:glycosyltransferase involved in cell wall biosynthesis